MIVAVLFRNTFSGKKDIMFCATEYVKEDLREGISKPKILTKKQFFNHHYPKIKHLQGVKELASKLY